MRILMLTPYLPFPLLSGGQIRSYNLIKKLSKKHEIVLYALIKEESERQYIGDLEKYCKEVRVFKRSKKPFTLKNILKTAISKYPFLVIRNHVPEAKAAIKQLLEIDPPDLIHAETFYMMPHLPQTQIPTILVEQTIEYLGYESFARKINIPGIKQAIKVDIAKIRRWEQHYWQSCEKLVVMSEADKELISAEVDMHAPIEVVPNGVDTAWFAKEESKRNPDPTVLFVGTFKWLPNVEAVSFLVEKVWPLIKEKMPKAKLWIVGNAPSKKVFDFQKKDTSITVTGGIPDIRTAFRQSHVLLAPIFSGKGTRYKILEAMASETPIIATPLAVEGLDLAEGKQVLLADSAQSLAKQTVRVLENKALQERLIKNSSRFVKENYDWQGVAKKLDLVYQNFNNEKEKN